MGLTIHYRLTTPRSRLADIRAVVETLRQHALDLPFDAVGEVVEVKDPAAREPDRKDEHFIYKLIACRYLDHEDRHVSVPARHLVAFMTRPGPGSEPALFGFARHPAYVTLPGKEPKRLATGLKGWSWSGFCKTQYASNPDHGGLDNFLRCHLTLTQLLDFAARTGFIDVDVQDEGGFWENRCPKKLADTVNDWNAMVAAVSGFLKDRFAVKGVALQSAIASFPNFEHLEARGRRRLRDLRKKFRDS